jgi:hypothetical protein
MRSSKLLRSMYWTICVNLVLWMSVMGMAINGARGVKAAAIAGFVFAAVAQHWAFYAMRKAERETVPL